MKRKIGYPKTKKLLKAFGYDVRTVLIPGYGPFTYLDRNDWPPKLRLHRQPAGLIVYPVFLWEKFRNLH